MTVPATPPAARWTGPPVDELLSVMPGEDPGSLLTLPGLLRACVRQHGTRTAILERERTASFADLLEYSAQVRDRLVAAGVVPGDRVGLHLDNGIDYAASLFGISRAGAVAVLLNTLWTERELTAAVVRSRVRVLLSRPRRPGDPPMLGLVGDAGPYPYGTPVPASAVGAVSDTLVSPDEDAVILYTSGSTGNPKAVVHRHRAPCLQSLRWSALLGLSQEDVLLSTSPYFWSSGLTKSLGASLVSGSAIVAIPRFSTTQALDAIERLRVTALISALHLDHQLVSDPEFHRRDLSSLRFVHRRSPIKRELNLSAEWNPGGYGLSEMFTLVASHPADTGPTSLDGADGWIVPGVDVKITDPGDGGVLPMGLTGRICVRGATLMRGYDAIESPFDEEGFLPTADLGELDSRGRLWFRGRSDSVIRSGGTNLSPAEVENALQGWHRVRRSAAVPVPHPTRGAALALCVVPADGTLSPGDVAEHLRHKLAAYKLPRKIIMLGPDDLRYTATHKVDLPHARQLAIHRLLDDDIDARWRDLLRRELS